MSARLLNDLLAEYSIERNQVDLAGLIATLGIPEHPGLLGLLAYLVDPLKSADLPNFRTVIDSDLPPFWRALAALHEGLAIKIMAADQALTRRADCLTLAIRIACNDITLSPTDDRNNAPPDLTFIYYAVLCGELFMPGSNYETVPTAMVRATQAGFKHGWCDARARAIVASERLVVLDRPELAHQVLDIVDEHRATVPSVCREYPVDPIRALYGF